ncbi:MAG: hypothetical protein EPN98_07805 [Phenylobacterium sp.]|uniref:peptidoglycan-binding protein n=1 Tax=Phenylobacterium sp. TaxID=1871053 RepID=UPI0011FE79D5|nr:peptidoglycan-binding protein [Phenylobacterium sp.]TAL34953.1 MAG: hypothetical protein EPN98_07805 [Phenylobacterium sp.]
MTWRERLALLLGAASPFAAGGPVMATPSVLPRLQDGRETVSPIQPLEFWSDPAHADHALQLAGHRSHSSHSSHRSHSSHVSGSGHASHYSGSTVTTPSPVYRAPAPVYTPPAPVYTPPTPRAPSTGGRTSSPVRGLPSTASPTPPAGLTSSGRLTQDTVSQFVQRVQIALMVKGYDPGPADGELSPKTRDALRAFQTASNLEVSGNMDVPTLNALGVLK